MKERLYRVDAERRSEIRRGLISALEQQPDIAFAYLHGSFLDVELGAFHDVDVAVWLADAAEQDMLHRKFDLENRLDAVAGAPVDVQILNDAALSFRFTVMRDGERIVCRDEELWAQIAESTAREYLDVEPLRRRAFKEMFGL